MRTDDYHMTIKKVKIDGHILHEARVREFPDLIECGDTVAEAREYAIDTMEMTIKILREQGRAIPQPLAAHDDFDDGRAMVASS